MIFQEKMFNIYFRFTVQYTLQLEKQKKSDEKKQVSAKTVFLCKLRCGEVFLSKEKRNHHEVQEHLHNRYITLENIS